MPLNSFSSSSGLPYVVICYYTLNSIIQLIIIAVAVVRAHTTATSASGVVQCSEHKLSQNKPKYGHGNCDGHVHDRHLLLVGQLGRAVRVLVLGRRRCRYRRG